jgi:hypothetical protein
MKKDPRLMLAPKTELIAVGIIQGSALSLLGWAFRDAGNYGLTADQRLIASWAFALLAGAFGYFFGGVFLQIAGKWGPVASFAIRATGASALFLAVLFLPLFAHASSREGCLNTSAADAPEDALLITSPADNSEVGPSVEVRGHTTHPRWRHYVVVAGPSGGDMIQDDLLKISRDGDLSSVATFGAAAVGVGGRYSIYLIESKTPLPPGPVVQGARVGVSPAVTVTRTR